MKGGAPRAIWFTSENDPHLVSARAVAHTLDAAGTPAHLIWNPTRGELLQLLPPTRAGTLLRSDTNPELDREGRVCLQIMVVGFARAPFTHAPLRELDAVMCWLDAWGVPRRWPSGPPLGLPQAFQCPRNRRQWARGGHFGQSQVPETEGPSPGAIDIRRITGVETPAAEIPRPRLAQDTAVLPARRPPRALESAPAPARTSFLTQLGEKLILL
ncbi:MAG: hypothetical protein ABIS86_23095 [Streptosporangiaceae bacterium]